jgi:predicted membrane protein
MTKRQQYINLFACAVFLSLILFIIRVDPLWYLVPGLILLAGLLNAAARKAILWLWLKFSHLLGTVNSTILLFLIYFLVITPYAVLFRKKVAVNYILRKPQAKSLFKERDHRVVKEDFEKSW